VAERLCPTTLVTAETDTRYLIIIIIIIIIIIKQFMRRSNMARVTYNVLWKLLFGEVGTR